jgi:hypothetical protein
MSASFTNAKPYRNRRVEIDKVRAVDRITVVVLEVVRAPASESLGVRGLMAQGPDVMRRAANKIARKDSAGRNELVINREGATHPSE